MPIHEIVRPIPRALPLDTAGGFACGSFLLVPSVHRTNPRGSTTFSPLVVLSYTAVASSFFPSSEPTCLLASIGRGRRHPPAVQGPFVTCLPVRCTWGRPDRMGGDPSLPPSVTRHPSWLRPSPTIVRSMRPQRPSPDGTENGKDPHHHRMDTIGERAWQRAFHRPKS